MSFDRPVACARLSDSRASRKYNKLSENKTRAIWGKKYRRWEKNRTDAQYFSSAPVVYSIGITLLYTARLFVSWSPEQANRSVTKASSSTISHFEVGRETGSRCCQSALWDCFGERIFNMAANSSHNALRQPSRPRVSRPTSKWLSLPSITLKNFRAGIGNGSGFLPVTYCRCA